ncbi:MAG TPA: hypothetical protein DCW90_00735 [Lachnospiraceae bacterium]|nr:hypothetical protein [Lachnospiraceae bacterium]
MTEATVTHQLSILKEAGLVRTEKNGKFVFYEFYFNRTVPAESSSTLQSCSCTSK